MALAYKNFIPEYWSKKLTANYDNIGKMMSCVNTDWEKDLKDGDTVNIQTFGNVTVSTYNGTLDYETPTEETQQMVLDQRKSFAFKVPDIDKVQSNINLVNGYMGRSKIAVGLAKDTYLLGKHSDVPAANTLGTVGSPVALTKDNVDGYIVDLGAILKDNNATVGRDGKAPWLVINPTIEKLMLKSPEWISAGSEKINKDLLINGSVAQYRGFNVMLSTNFVAVSSKYYLMAGTTDAITYASQIDEVESLRDPDSFNDLVRGLYVYGAKTVVPTALAKLICTVA